MYQKDQIVVYRYNVCRVIDVLPAFREGEDYYRFRGMYDESLVITVPASLADKHARPIISQDEAKELIDGVPTYSEIATDSDTIQTVCSAHIKEGGHLDLLRMVKARHQQKCSSVKPLTQWKESDKSAFRSAENILYRELSVALGEPSEIIRQSIYDRVTPVVAQLT